MRMVPKCCDPGAKPILGTVMPFGQPSPLPMSSAPATNAAELPDVDPDALTRLERFGGRKLLREMIALFVEIAPARLSTALRAVAEGRMATAENELHSLKSSSAQLGAMKLSRLSERGELLARAGLVTGITETLLESRTELARVQSWLVGEREARGA
jgi:two-component system, sensor histidine kinase and response regulator